MTDKAKSKLISRVFVIPSVVTVGLWILSLIVAITLFIQAAVAAKSAADGTTIPKSFIGLPMLEGFHEAGHFGIHVQWGLLVLLIVPFLIGVALTVRSLVKLRARG